MACRTIPNLLVLRPCDANEAVVASRIAFEQFIEKPNVVLTDVYNWLGISPLLIEKRMLINSNPGKMFRFAFLHTISLKLFKLIKKRIANDTFILFRNV